jgi:CheY-like chemotaxis protein
MNGSIKVESVLGEGSSFRIELALKLAENRESDSESAKRRSRADIGYGKYKGKRFLLVDDNEMNREIGEELLGMLGAEIVLASGGDEALDILNSSEPYDFDLVFMDIQMPIKNGYETVREIRASSREDIRKMIVFAMTANAFSEDVRRSIQAGMNEHISKPLDLGLLCSVLDKYM